MNRYIIEFVKNPLDLESYKNAKSVIKELLSNDSNWDCYAPSLTSQYIFNCQYFLDQETLTYLTLRLNLRSIRLM